MNCPGCGKRLTKDQPAWHDSLKNLTWHMQCKLDDLARARTRLKGNPPTENPAGSPDVRLTEARNG